MSALEIIALVAGIFAAWFIAAGAIAEHLRQRGWKYKGDIHGAAAFAPFTALVLLGVWLVRQRRPMPRATLVRADAETLRDAFEAVLS